MNSSLSPPRNIDWFIEHIRDKYGLGATAPLYYSVDRGRSWYAYFQGGITVEDPALLLKAMGKDLRLSFIRACKEDFPFNIGIRYFSGSRGMHTVSVYHYPHGGTYTTYDLNDLCQEIQDFLINTIMEEFLDSTEKEYDYLTGDEATKERIECNEYEFYEAGEMV